MIQPKPHASNFELWSWSLCILTRSVSNLQMCVFDIETTIPATDVIEFGCVVLDAARLFEVAAFSTLIHSSNCSKRSIECNGITNTMLADAPTFAAVAPHIFQLMNGKVWAGYNIEQFDIPKITAAFAQIGQPAPVAHSVIDAYPLLTKTFGKRAGDMKLASLMRHFEMGTEAHRALDDARQTVEVLKRCSMLLFLEENGHTFPTPVVAPAATAAAPAVASAATAAAPASAAEPATPTKQAAAPKAAPAAAIVARLNEAMAKKETPVWVSYDGGANAKIPRPMKVVRWENEPVLFAAFCLLSNSIKNFSSAKVLEVRDEKWTIEPAVLFTPLKASDGAAATTAAAAATDEQALAEATVAAVEPAAPAAPAPATS
jgi:DNA polymerase III epsilon subunit-like protein